MRLVLKVKMPFLVWQLPHCDTMRLNLIIGRFMPDFMKCGYSFSHIASIMSQTSFSEKYCV